MTTHPSCQGARVLASACLLLVATLASATAGTLVPTAVGDAPVYTAIAGRANVALASLGGVAFSSSDLTPDYAANRVSDGVINHTGNSWIPLTAASTEYVAVRFAKPITLESVVWHGQDGYGWRSDGTYSLEYTTDPAPSGSSAWTQIGVYTYPCGESIMPRTLFAFAAVANVTAVRLVVGSCEGTQTAVQEFEAYAPMVVVATGDAAVATALAGAPNLALASAGGLPFSSSDLTPDYAANRVNDGVIDGSGNSWIPLTTANTEYVGVEFASPLTLGAVVWQGQNGYANRSDGTYSLEYTTDPAPSSSSAWTQIGIYVYPCNDTIMPRTLFVFPAVADVTAMRLVVASCADASPTAVQEFEAYEGVAGFMTPQAVGDAPVATAIAGRHNEALAACGAVAFSSSDLLPTWIASRVNDGSSAGDAWIADGADGAPYVAVKFASPIALSAVVWVGVYDNRAAGIYHLQYTTDADPSGASTWTEIGWYTYPNCGTILPRTLFSFAPVDNVTAMRLVTTRTCSGDQLAVHEFEAYGSSPSLLMPNAVGDAPVATAIGGRVNVAQASQGGVAFASSELTDALPHTYVAGHVNDGVTDNSGFSWIPATTAANEYVAVTFSAAKTLASVVWQGQLFYNGRSSGTYVLEYTTDPAPSASSCWRTIGQYTYVEPGCSTPMPRTLFSFSPLVDVTAVRLVRPSVDCSLQAAVQELEAYEPFSVPPEITSPPEDASAMEGSDVSFSVTANYTERYQWRVNEVDVPGATTSTFTMVDVGMGDSGSRITVVCYNGFDMVTSAPVALTVGAAPVYGSYFETVSWDLPIHYYPLDETAAGIAIDYGTSAGPGGTDLGGITPDQAALSPYLGRCRHFDGTAGTFVDLGLFHPGNAVSVEAWVRLDSDATRDGWSAIVARWDGSYELDFNSHGSDLGNFVVRNDADAVGIPAAPAPSAREQWHHLVGVFTNGVATVYVDGVQGAVVNMGGVLRDAGPLPDRVLIGATRDGTIPGGAWNFKGFIDEVAIYDYALSAGQVRAHYRAPLNVSPKRMLPPTPTANGWLLRFEGLPGYTYRLQRTTVLGGSWDTVATLLAPENGIVEWEDTNPPPSQAFYRTVCP